MKNTNFPQFINENTGKEFPFPPHLIRTCVVRYKPFPTCRSKEILMYWSESSDCWLTENTDLALPPKAIVEAFMPLDEIDKGWNIPASETIEPLSLEDRLEAWQKKNQTTRTINAIIHILRHHKVLVGVAQSNNGVYDLKEALLLRDFLKEFPEVFKEENMNKILRVYPWYKILFDAWESFDLAVTARQKNGEVVEESNPASRGLVDFIDSLGAEMGQTFNIFQKYEEVKDDRKGT
jgi:hypothetical protein